MSSTSNVTRIKGQPSVRDRVSAAEWEARVELAAAHHPLKIVLVADAEQVPTLCREGRPNERAVGLAAELNR